MNITREVIILHRTRNTRIVPAQLGGSSSGDGASLAADPVSTAKIQAHFREDPEDEQEEEEEEGDSRDLSDAISHSSNGSNAQTEINSQPPPPPPTATTTAAENPSSAAAGQTKTSAVRELQARDLKAVKVLGVTASVYFIAWGPYVVLVVLLSFFPQIPVPGQIRFAFMWLANSNSFMNVFIYSLMYSGFRRNAVVLLRTLLAHLLSCIGIQMQTVKIGDINLHTQMSQMSAAESYHKTSVLNGKCTEGQTNM